MNVIPNALKKAKRSILIEQQYIHNADVPVAQLLEAIKAARDENEELNVRIILGKIFSNKDLVNENTNLANIKTKYGLKLAANIRYIDTTRLVHCHNKLVIIDGDSPRQFSKLVEGGGAGESRGGLLFKHIGVAGYLPRSLKWIGAPRNKSCRPRLVPTSLRQRASRRAGSSKCLQQTINNCSAY